MTAAVAADGRHGSDVEDPSVGLVTSMLEAAPSARDPDVAVQVARIADIKAYDWPLATASDGSGAGLTGESAYGAAIGECCERYALATIPADRFVRGSAGALEAATRPVEPERWALFDATQRERGLPYPPFDPDLEISWLEASELTTCVERLVPACLVSLPFDDERHGPAIAPSVSTGAACAPSLPAAVLACLCELIERDAFMIAWRNRLSLPHVRISAPHPLADVFAERFARPHLEYNIVQTTLDLDVPSFFGWVRDRRRRPPAIVAGGAAHPDPQRAVMKTLLELAQGLRWLDHLSPLPSVQSTDFSQIRSFEDRVRMYAFCEWADDAFTFLSDGGETYLGDIEPFPEDGEPRALISELGARQVEALAVDLTPSDVHDAGLVVARVLCPSLEVMEGDHVVPLLGGRRWRDVPVRLGLAAQPPGIEDINPWPHPYP
jgi:ribosomal protein S12 methylthiotransferase accessory factor